MSGGRRRERAEGGEERSGKSDGAEVSGRSNTCRADESEATKLDG